MIVVLLIVVFDVAVLASYPFPDQIDALRTPFYVILGIAILIAATFITFLGYRIASMRVVRESRPLFVIFLPAVALIGSGIGFLLLAAPR
jgi:hypothetical protein